MPWAANPAIGYRDSPATLLDETPSNRNNFGNDPNANGSGFPVALGEAFAMRFEQLYLNYRPSTVTQRAQPLAAFIPGNVKKHGPQFGGNGARRASSDRAAGNALASQLPGFFQAFASGNRAALSRYLAPGASVDGLGGAVGFDGITSLRVPQGGATRDITVTIGWVLPGQVGTGAPRLTISYVLSVVDQQTGRWYVKDIRASTQPMGTQ